MGIMERVMEHKRAIGVLKNDNEKMSYVLMTSDLELVNNYTTTFIVLAPRVFIDFAEAIGNRQEAWSRWYMYKGTILDKQYSGMKSDTKWSATVDNLIQKKIERLKGLVLK